MVNFLRLSFFEVFNSNFNILNTLNQISLKIDMHYRKTLFEYIPKYFLFRNSSFRENGKTKVYALEDSLGVVSITYLKCIKAKTSVTGILTLCMLGVFSCFCCRLW